MIERREERIKNKEKKVKNFKDCSLKTPSTAWT